MFSKNQLHDTIKTDTTQSKQMQLVFGQCSTFKLETHPQTQAENNVNQQHKGKCEEIALCVHSGRLGVD
jgi:hypothetical protein